MITDMVMHSRRSIFHDTTDLHILSMCMDTGMERDMDMVTATATTTLTTMLILNMSSTTKWKIIIPEIRSPNMSSVMGMLSKVSTVCMSPMAPLELWSTTRISIAVSTLT
ncbi:unnamed protein product, partial [Iphiclides podalirius]